MVVDGGVGHAEPVGDLLGAQAREDQAQAFALALGQGLEAGSDVGVLHRPRLARRGSARPCATAPSTRPAAASVWKTVELASSKAFGGDRMMR